MRSSISGGSGAEVALLITMGKSWTVNVRFGKAFASAMEA